MPLDPRNEPNREIVTAYVQTFGNEAGKTVLADLDRFVELNMASKRDKLDRIDPYQVIAQAAAERVVKRIRGMIKKATDREWLEMDRVRQIAVAETKL